MHKHPKYLILAISHSMHKQPKYLISSHLMEEDDRVEFKIIVQDISYVSPRLRTVPRTV
jgi:transcriptional regulator of NAD metabolism